MKTKLNLLGLLLCLPFAGITAQTQESKVMQIHSGGSVVYEVPTAQVDSVTFESKEAPIDNCGPVFTENTVWKCTEYEGVVIEIIFYPAENKLQISSVPAPEDLNDQEIKILSEYCYGTNDYCIRMEENGGIMYMKRVDGGSFLDRHPWPIRFLSQNEMHLIYPTITHSVPFPPGTFYRFFRQTD